jgi:hypothetical protein
MAVSNGVAAGDAEPHARNGSAIVPVIFWGDPGGRFHPGNLSGRALDHPKYALRMPAPAALRRDAASSQFRSHLPRRHSGAFHFGQDRREPLGPLDRLRAMCRRKPISPIAAHTNAASFRGLQQAALILAAIISRSCSATSARI